ncbi:MAG: hypothetical protein ACOXZV_00560 [Bacteroidales bacterium]|jgi:hypothetical protein
MKIISEYIFNSYLRENDSYDYYYEEISRMCYLFPYSAKDKIIYSDVVNLNRIGRYFVVNITIEFNDNRRTFYFSSLKELTLDEYLDSVMQEKEFREAYFKLREFLM